MSPSPSGAGRGKGEGAETQWRMSGPGLGDRGGMVSEQRLITVSDLSLQSKEHDRGEGSKTFASAVFVGTPQRCGI